MGANRENVSTHLRNWSPSKTRFDFGPGLDMPASGGGAGAGGAEREGGWGVVTMF